MKKAEEDIKVVVTFSEGYQTRFTEACLEQLKKREENNPMKKYILNQRAVG